LQNGPLPYLFNAIDLYSRTWIVAEKVGPPHQTLFRAQFLQMYWKLFPPRHRTLLLDIRLIRFSGIEGSISIEIVFLGF
jgi:hypothetical protein